MSSRNISLLKSYLKNIDNLSPYEFEEMVAEMYRCKGWSNVQVTQPSGDKGRDIIGFDRKGRKIYVEVKKHQGKIGRPVIQKLHSIMVSQNVEKGIVITTSDFTPQAIAYALKVNIFLIEERPRSTSLCTSVDIETILTQSESVLNNSIFSYPLPPSRFIKKREMLPFNYVRFFWIKFSLNHEFQNSTGSWRWTMSYQDQDLYISPNGLAELIPKFDYKDFEDLSSIKQKLGKYKIPFIKNKYSNYSIEEIKSFIQKVTTVVKTYIGRNNQEYSITCQPSSRNISIKSINNYWKLYTGIDLTLTNNYFV